VGLVGRRSRGKAGEGGDGRPALGPNAAHLRKHICIDIVQMVTTRVGPTGSGPGGGAVPKGQTTSHFTAGMPKGRKKWQNGRGFSVLAESIRVATKTIPRRERRAFSCPIVERAREGLFVESTLSFFLLFPPYLYVRAKMLHDYVSGPPSPQRIFTLPNKSPFCSFLFKVYFQKICGALKLLAIMKSFPFLSYFYLLLFFIFFYSFFLPSNYSLSLSRRTQ
jgi:hypothetical protein